MFFSRDAWLIVSSIIQVAFKTGDYKQQVIFIGGLTDGFMATEYVFIEGFFPDWTFHLLHLWV